MNTKYLVDSAIYLNQVAAIVGDLNMLTPVDLYRVMTSQAHRCKFCRQPHTSAAPLVARHAIPLDCRRGHNQPDNIVWICAGSCTQLLKSSRVVFVEPTRWGNTRRSGLTFVHMA